MKFRFLIALVWLAGIGALTAQPTQPGAPDSLESRYGASPATPPQMFQKPPSPQPLQVGANLTNNTTNGTGSPINNLTVGLPNDAGGQPPVVGNIAPPATGNTTTGVAASGDASANYGQAGPDLSNFPLPMTMDGIDNDRKLVPGDQLVFQIVEDREPPFLVLVSEDGTIPVHWTNQRINVEGQTLRAAVQLVKAQLDDPSRNFYATGHPTILAAFYHSNLSRGKVSITGAVQKPGSISIPPNSILTLWDVIQAAGDFRADADKEHVKIIHRTSGEVPTTAPTTAPATPNGTATPPAAGPDASDINVTVVNIDDLLKKGLPDLPMRPGDYVVVPSKVDTSGYVTVYGEGVTRPGPIPISPTCHTVSQAVIMAGYDSRVSKLSDVHLYRNETDPKTGAVKPMTYVVDLDAVIFNAKTAQDKELQKDDVIKVDNKWFISPF